MAVPSAVGQYEFSVVEEESSTSVDSPPTGNPKYKTGDTFTRQTRHTLTIEGEASGEQCFLVRWKTHENQSPEEWIRYPAGSKWDCEGSDWDEGGEETYGTDEQFPETLVWHKQHSLGHDTGQFSFKAYTGWKVRHHPGHDDYGEWSWEDPSPIQRPFQVAN